MKKQSAKVPEQPEKANDINMSVGNISRRDFPAPKTSGIKVRGGGAATKGVTARGPMA